MPVEELEVSELKTPLVYAFLPSELWAIHEKLLLS